jgi:ribosomal protein S18 acetylase RimI-like enzyme
MSFDPSSSGCQDRAVHPLDNPAWHALTGPQRTVAEHHRNAARYQRDKALFAALPDEPDGEDWDALGELIDGGDTYLARRTVTQPAGWHEILRLQVVQMVGPEVEGRPDPGALVLGPDDVPEMLDLVRRTEPGPFLDRTIELGTYLGLRLDGALVAMAGERMHLDGYREISGVCTDPAHTGGGFGTRLVRDLIERIRGEGDVPLLHVLVTNPARDLYEHLGFVERERVEVAGLRRVT